MTCKECIHFDVCEALEEGNCIPKAPPRLCGCFKDKSRFIELPCKVGAENYILKADGVWIFAREAGKTLKERENNE